MAGLTDKAGILFRIKADSDDAIRDIGKVKNEITGLGTTAATASGGLASMVNPTALAATALAALGAAAVTAVTGLINLTQAASDYGSKINDATLKSGASVQTVQALGFAAEQSGSSMEAISGSLAKFSNLLGQASLGNEKAQATLKQFGITATDVDGAVAQAVVSIRAMKSETEQNAAAATLFKDRGGEVVKTIREMNGDLPETIAKLEALGLMMSDEDTKAADAFGDTLGLLSKQTQMLGYQFASEFMPLVTGALSNISSALANNRGAARIWGEELRLILSGVINYFDALANGVSMAFSSLARSFDANLGVTVNWARIMIITLTPVLSIFQQIGSALGGIGAEISAGANLAGQIAGSKSGIRLPSFANAGGGGGGGGGRTPRDTSAADAERARKEAEEAAERERKAIVKAAEDAMRATLEIYDLGYAKRIAALDLALSQGFILEMEHVRDVARIREEAIQDEITQNKKLLQNDRLNGEERAEIEQKLRVLGLRLDIAKLKTSKDLTDQAKKELAAKEKQLQVEKDILETARKLRNERAKAAAQAAIDDDRKEQARIAAERANSFQLGGGSGYQTDQLLKIAEHSLAATAGVTVLREAFNLLGQAVGQAVQAFVLYGSAGTSFRKVTAQILASLAQMAAVKAIFELAEGLAALARAFFGDPKAGAEAAMHFKSAAMYGIIAGVAAVAGRATAGDSFKQSSGSATGGNTGGGNANNEPNRYTTQFNGYGQGRDNALVKMLDRVNTTLGAVEETQHQFNRKVLGMSPTDVVVLGANGASREIRGAVESELSSDVRATDGMMRGLGFAR
jgi:hypothetical protein